MYKYISARSMRCRMGFTLIEMAIVLVIIGLITGTIIASRTMIRQSQVNSSMADVQQYIKATLAFRDKYGALPGDMANATGYWGATATPSPSACNGVSGSGTQTCDGDGNGQIGTAATSLSGNYEQLRFWQHLADAQLISGIYTGVGNSTGTYDHLFGTNIPKSRVDGAGYSVSYIGVITCTSSADTSCTNSTYYWPGTYGHVFTLGNHIAGTVPYAATLTGEEASAYDAKFDDGFPSTGQIMTYNSNTLNTTCVTTSSGQFVYVTATKGLLCSLIFISGF